MADLRTLPLPSLDRSTTIQSRAALIGLFPAGLLGASACGFLPATMSTSTAAWTAAAVLISMAAAFLGGHRLRQKLLESESRRMDVQRRLRLDPLTDLMNRAAFVDALDHLSELGQAGSTVIVLFFDLDRFKEVNDTLGHKVGDLLLRHVAQRATDVIPEKAVLARLGGDEYAAIIPLEDGTQVDHYGQQLVLAINEPFAIDGQIVTVGASVGIAIGDPTLDDGHELLRRADVAMYEVKGTSRGGWRVFDDVLDGRQIRESSIRVELGRSLVEEEFLLHYQPLVDARTNNVSSVEALLRSRSGPLRDVPPGTIIEIAEKSGQIMPLTDWTLDTALKTIQTLGNIPVAVNLSPVYFRHPEFVHRVFDKLLQARVRPELLTVEVTEGVLISDMDAARNAINRLREIGINVFLDDFGTGYSSLSYLQNFELDGLKLDKSFLRNVNDKRKTTQIIRSVIDFGHSLGMRVVVEGVESDWQARLLQLLGCDLLQGYDIAMPMSLEDFQIFLTIQRRAREPEPHLSGSLMDISVPR